MNKLLFAILMLCALFACNEESTGSRQQTDAAMKSRLEQLMVLWETGDTALTRELFSVDGRYTDVANNFTYQGIDGINSYVGHIHGWASEVKMTAHTVRATGHFGYVEWTLTGAQSSPIGQRVPVATNRQITLNGVTLAEFKDGKIATATDYMDVLGFVLQLGAKVDLPGGTVLGE